ncbi:response regulator [Paenibacillus thermotolerans]|uniref:response regulator n=1 Tax=Paenibacillus thermotolerans TaxID=3027807 RepID=UPI002368371B|nr:MULTISPECIES: response regulator transcription factor [unclassified Paenibacillus]
MNPIKVLLVDDHAIVRQGLSFFLQMQPDVLVVGEAANGKEAVDKTKELQPDVVLMDLIMPEMNGIEATREIRQQPLSAKVIVLTTFADKDHVLPAIQAGAGGYLLKDTDPEQIVAAIRGVHAGQPQLHPAVAGQLMSHLSEPAPQPASSPDQLTKREKEVLCLIARGMSNKEIAAECGVAEKTVKVHVSNVLSKLGVADRTQAALYAVKHGFVEL